MLRPCNNGAPSSGSTRRLLMVFHCTCMLGVLLKTREAVLQTGKLLNVTGRMIKKPL